MATPKKKHLIELMIEAGVKWPEGAEYAAQDKCDLYVWFYSEKPKFAGVNKGNWTGDVNYENGRKCIVVDGENLNEICTDWHQTIVTREQYAEAAAAFSGETNQVKESEYVGPYATHENTESLSINLVPQNGFYKPNGTSETPVDAVEWHNQPSIEQLTADYRAKAAEADRLQSVADEALKAADDALLALEKAGKLIGLVISVDTKWKHVEQQEQPAITKWRDLRVGDVIECIEPCGGGISTGDDGVITSIASGHLVADFIKQKDYTYTEPHFGCGFKFIRRP